MARLVSNARISQNPRYVQAIIDAVEEMHRTHGARGEFDAHDLINWLNAHRNSEFKEIHDSYPGADPVLTGDQQIGRFLYTLGQIKTGNRTSLRGIEGREGVCEVSVWEISPRTIAALKEARAVWLGAVTAPAQPGGPAADWFDRLTGSFKDDPAFEKILEYGREFRWADRPSEDESAEG